MAFFAGSQQVTGLMVDALRAGITTYATFDEAQPYGSNGSSPLVPQPKPYEVPELVPFGGSPPMLMYLLRSIFVQQPIRFKLGGRPVLSAHLNAETARSERKRPES